MRGTRSTTVVALVAVGILVATSVAPGGDLNPPAGPITATDRSILSQATTPGPHTILAPGSYKLTSDLTGGPTVLTIIADDVTVDLNGFTIDGGGAPGPVVSVAGSNVTIRNGTVRNTGSEGINAAGEGAAIERVSVHDCGLGIVATGGARITGCDLRDIQNDGIIASFSSTVTDCTVVRAGLGGFGWGMIIAEGSCATGCTVRDSTNGIQGTGSATIDRCAVSSNGSVGILAENGAVVRGCSARFNNTGYLVRNSSVLDSVAFQSFLYGFELPNDARVDRCSSVESANSGFWLGDRSTVTNSNSARDAAAGIGAGFETTGDYNRVSNNTAIESSNDNFLINGLLNTVYANSAANAGSGTNYNVAPGNDVAPQTPAALSASGNENITN